MYEWNWNFRRAEFKTAFERTDATFPRMWSRVGAYILGIAVVATSATMSQARDIEAKSPEGKGSYRIASEFSLGGPDANDPAQFYEKVGSIQVHADGAGNIYVLDNGNTRVQVFDPKGKFLRSIGKAGEGPGEFQMPAKISVNKSGDLAVFDMVSQRVTLFDAGGKLLRDQIVEGMLQDMNLRDDRSLLCSLDGNVELVAYEPGGDIRWDHGRTEPDPNENRMELRIEGNLSTIGTRLVELGDRNHEGDVWLGSKGEYGVRTVKEGAQVHTLSRPFERVEMTFPSRDDDEDGEGGGIRTVMITVDDEGGGAGGGSGGGEANFTMSEGDGEGMQFNMADIRKMMPKFQADIRGMIAWPDDRVWVITAEDKGDEIVTDEWTADGTYLRRFTIPRYDRYSLGADGKLYAVGHDDDDYPIVYRLTVDRVQS